VEDESVTDTSEDHYEIVREKILELVKRHQLNEIVARFHMRDGLPFSIADVKRLYLLMQEAIIRELGAPLAPSLFPGEIFEETAPGSAFSSQDLPSSQRPNYHPD
jgi:hypothetical protein